MGSDTVPTIFFEKKFSVRSSLGGYAYAIIGANRGVPVGLRTGDFLCGRGKGGGVATGDDYSREGDWLQQGMAATGPQG